MMKGVPSGWLAISDRVVELAGFHYDLPMIRFAVRQELNAEDLLCGDQGDQAAGSVIGPPLPW